MPSTMQSKDSAVKSSATAARPASSWFVHSTIILGAAAIAITALLIKGPSCGHDFAFHLTSWVEALESWRNGILYPHWAASTNWGAGEPRFVFYPPISWMLGAALGAILPWRLVPVALTFLMLAACGFGTRALGRLFLSEAQATLAGCLVIFSGYALFCAYTRAAFGELLGGFWIPVILLLALRSRRREGNAWRRALDGSTAPLAIAIVGAWLSNGPVGVMACYLLVAVATLAAVLERSWAKIIRATVAVAFGIAVTGFYLVSVAQEKDWVNIRAATDNPWVQVENNFLFSDNPTMKDHAKHDDANHEVSLIAVVMLALTAGAIFTAWSRYRLPERQQWMPLAAIPLAVLFLLLPISQPVWDSLPLMRMLQFPWRWLLTLEAPMAIFLALAIWPDTTVQKSQRRKHAAKTGGGHGQQIAAVFIYGALFLAGIVAEFAFFQSFTETDYTLDGLLGSYGNGSGLSGQLEYAPDGAGMDVALFLPGACLTSQPLTPLGLAMTPAGRKDVVVQVWKPTQGSCEATYAMEKGPSREGMEHYQLRAELPHPGYLILRLRRYPAWRVSVNGRTVESMPEREDGLMAVPAPAGTVNVDVDWTTMPDVTMGRWLSAVSALALIGFWFLERRQARRPQRETLKAS
jgi:hypothetical protein